jgi:hypothetical protein
MIRYTLCTLMFLGMCASATAQVIEIGAGIGRACVGTDGSTCGYDRGAMSSIYSSVWFDDRLEVSARFATMPLPDWKYSQYRDDRFNLVADPAARQLPRVDVTVRDRSRQIVTGEAIYHFARGRPVRGFLGLGFGNLTNRDLVSCAPAGCERVMPFVSSPVGRLSHTSENMTIIAGASGRISKRLRVQGGFRFHNLPAEGRSTTEAFVAAGHQFGRH